MILSRVSSAGRVSEASPISHGGFCRRRMSASVDDSLSERGGADSIRKSAARISTKKHGFWLWKSRRPKTASQEARSAVCEKEEAVPSRWKFLVQKLRSKAKDSCRPSVCSSFSEVRVAHPAVMNSCRREEGIKSASMPEDKQQRFCSEHPEPASVQKRLIGTPIWERRQAACPSTLDVRNLKVRRRRLSRPQQVQV